MKNRIANLVERQALKIFSYFEKSQYLKGKKKVRKDQLPDFLCIGAQKAGSTWLYENLRCHPEIFMPDERELHYFDHQFYRPLSFYVNYFKGNETKIKGESMPGYGLLDQKRIEFIHQIIPDLKIIYLLRNPIDRAWSHAKMSFTKFHNRPLASVAEEEFISHFQGSLSVEKGNYLKIINRWESVYPKEAFSFFFLEEIKQYPEKSLNTIFEYLSVSKVSDFNGYKTGQIINPGEPSPIPPNCLKFLEKMYKRDNHQLAERFGGPARLWLKKHYE